MNNTILSTEYEGKKTTQGKKPEKNLNEWSLKSIFIHAVKILPGHFIISSLSGPTT